VTVGGVTYTYGVESVEVIAAKLAAAIEATGNVAYVRDERARLIVADRVASLTAR